MVLRNSSTNPGAIASPPSKVSEVSIQCTLPSLRAMKPSRLAAMWMVTRELDSSITPRRVSIRQLFRIPAAQGECNDILDEVRLAPSIVLARVGIVSRDLRGNRLFEAFVLARSVGMIAKVVAKCQGPAFFLSTPFHDVHVMRVRPQG